MVKVWICILLYYQSASSYGPAATVVDNLARVEDCHRVGKNWRNATDQYGTYRCIEVLKAK